MGPGCYPGKGSAGPIPANTSTGPGGLAAGAGLFVECQPVSHVRAGCQIWTGLDGTDSMRWLEAPGDALFFARDPGFLFLANLGPVPLRLPEFREVLLASGSLLQGTAGLSDGSLPPDTAVWLSA